MEIDPRLSQAELELFGVHIHEMAADRNIDGRLAVQSWLRPSWPRIAGRVRRLGEAKRSTVLLVVDLLLGRGEWMVNVGPWYEPKRILDEPLTVRLRAVMCILKSKGGAVS